MSSKSPGPGKRKQFLIKILMLDDSEVPFQIDYKTSGSELTNLVYQYLKLIESDYFGLEYIDLKGKKCWLDFDKPVSKQVVSNAKLIFCVKFYTPDPGQLEEEYTRYLYALQIKRDLAEGILLCSDATACLLASYILQAEIGDYLETFGNNSTYFQNRKFFPHQTEEHVVKIIDYHKNHLSQTPADADLNLLDIARKIELYGIIMHPAKDHEGVQLNLAVAHMGILVFQNYTKINTFSWAKIRKLSFKRKKFLVKLHPETYGFYKDTVEFYFDNRDDSKNFWKKCIEHHSFFRCISTQRMPRQKSKLLTRGSSFRYYGRTQKELIETAREHFSKNRSFDRSYHSMRSISQFAGTGVSTGGGGAGSSSVHQITGTQSLNRNLASRSTGALIMPPLNGGVGGASSNLSDSNDSASQFHSGSGINYPPGIQQQQQSSSAHHLAYLGEQNGKQTLGSIYQDQLQQKQNSQQPQQQISNNQYDERKNEIYSSQVAATSHQRPIYAKQAISFRDMDTSTHGSRTIDSRYSRDKTLCLSDEDHDDEDEEEDDEDEDDDREQNLNNEEDACHHHNNHHHQADEMTDSDILGIPINEKIIEDNCRCTCGHMQYDSVDSKENDELAKTAPLTISVGYGTEKPISESATEKVYSNRTFAPTTANSTYSSIKPFKDEPTVVSQTSSFRKTATSASNNANVITLPIQQESSVIGSATGARYRPTLKKFEPQVAQSSEATSNALALAYPPNPNKIYSRKEIISTTTYKEETKNTHLEEFHQTTTFYDSQTPAISGPALPSSCSGKPSSISPPAGSQQPAGTTGGVLIAAANAAAAAAAAAVHHAKSVSPPNTLITTTTTKTTTQQSLINVLDELNTTTTTTTTLTGGLSGIGNSSGGGVSGVIDSSSMQLMDNDNDEDDSTKPPRQHHQRHHHQRQNHKYDPKNDRHAADIIKSRPRPYLVSNTAVKLIFDPKFETFGPVDACNSNNLKSNSTISKTADAPTSSDSDQAKIAQSQKLERDFKISNNFQDDATSFYDNLVPELKSKKNCLTTTSSSTSSSKGNGCYISPHRININLTSVVVAKPANTSPLLTPYMCAPTAELDESISFSLGSSMSNQSSLSFLADLTATSESSKSDFSFLSSSSSSSSTCHSATRLNIYSNSHSISSDSSISLSSTLSATVPIEMLAKDWNRKLLKHTSRRLINTPNTNNDNLEDYIRNKTSTSKNDDLSHEYNSSKYKSKCHDKELLIGSQRNATSGFCRISAIQFNAGNNKIHKKVYREKYYGSKSVISGTQPSSSRYFKKDISGNKHTESVNLPPKTASVNNNKTRKFKSLPRMTKFIEIVDIRRLPDCKSVSYRDDTIDNPDKLTLKHIEEPPSASANEMHQVIDKLDLCFSTRILPVKPHRGVFKTRTSNRQDAGFKHEPDKQKYSKPDLDSLSESSNDIEVAINDDDVHDEYEKDIEECLENHNETSCFISVGGGGDTIEDEISLSTRILSLSNEISPINENHINMASSSYHPPLIASFDLLLAQTPDADMNIFTQFDESTINNINEEDKNSHQNQNKNDNINQVEILVLDSQKIDANIQQKEGNETDIGCDESFSLNSTTTTDQINA